MANLRSSKEGMRHSLADSTRVFFLKKPLFQITFILLQLDELKSQILQPHSKDGKQ